jgi:hypothetical protein
MDGRSIPVRTICRPSKIIGLLFVLGGAFAAPGEARSAVPFDVRSPFQRPLPKVVHVDPSSAAAVAALVKTGLGINLNTGAWTPTVFRATGREALQVVRMADGYALRVPMPSAAVPSADTDGGMEIQDPVRGCAYDFFRAARGADGSWTARGSVVFRLRGSGVHRGWSTRASGFALGAGLITPGDVRTGVIRHALVIGIPRTSPIVRLPATTSDGRDPGGLPMGAHLQLDPAFDISQLPRDQRPIAQAMQRYGVFVGETSGAIALYAQNTASTGGFRYPSSWSQGLSHGPEIVAHLRLLPAPAAVRLDATPTSTCTTKRKR